MKIFPWVEVLLVRAKGEPMSSIFCYEKLRDGKSIAIYMAFIVLYFKILVLDLLSPLVPLLGLESKVVVVVVAGKEERRKYGGNNGSKVLVSPVFTNGESCYGS
ncbi:hypothetical protein CMV_030098 [Castanea mollissima]|uniref:Uncharacterized protein n=1 Tax=Castanea mollissima TaxID=60419 RepID=A0A8J4Q1Q0_9ROSI|nr:hypothetical protein CMV_030098 [Castanea mollissima]